MASLAEVAPCPSRNRNLIAVDGHDFDAGLVEPQIQFRGPRFTQSRLDHHGELED